MRISDWSSDVCSSDLLKYVKAKDLADRLAEVFGGSGSRNGRGGGGLMPGLQPTEIRDGGIEGDFTSSAAVGGGTNRSDGEVGGGQIGRESWRESVWQ